MRFLEFFMNIRIIQRGKEVRELRFLFPFLKKYWHTGLLAVFFLVAEVVIDLYQPRMMATIVNNGILGLSNGGRPDLNLVISTGWKMLGLVLVCLVLPAVLSLAIHFFVRKAYFRHNFALALRDVEQGEFVG